ncbi:MAG: polysaccharide biosynthesis tyrosine autokinase [Alphaproteobacteria bacterium]|uniref:Polysaccharide biosynthesis tyrosine autokinase n=1 Tax=Candidatus Nitrobium versatile TaxID=2884831 RepID=A0A953JCQ0_9BACT|nr:polysaccharide biosynthesis tyrosine autokinase [Candidatus Nitrobium versatile]
MQETRLEVKSVVKRSFPSFGKGDSTGDVVVETGMVDEHIVCITDPYSLAAEQYRRIRARLLKMAPKETLTTIMVTSPDMGEGKSTTCLNLAVTMAREIDYTVLIVDADLRNPSLHRYLGLKPKYGLSEYLSGKVELKDVLVRTGMRKLVLLPAGDPPENPSELLSSDRMRMLVHELKYRYRDRYVFFDSSPVLATADAFSLGRHMDGIIMVVQATHTTSKMAVKAASLMKGLSMLGVIFNNVPKYLGNSVYPYRYMSRGGYLKGPEAARRGLLT